MAIQVQASQPGTMTLDAFNGLPAPAAESHLLALCGSSRWASTLGHKRPFHDAAHMQHAASNLWFLLDEPDWLEAFACHPRIGESRAPASPAFLEHSSNEQQVAQQSLAPVADALFEGNRRYEDRFGFLYIVFASGRSAPELLALLEQRLRNDRITELHEAARQQNRITSLRLQTWLQQTRLEG